MLHNDFFNLFFVYSMWSTACKGVWQELTEAQRKKRLGDKEISYIANGKKTIVFLEVVQNDYNGKTYFQ